MIKLTPYELVSHRLLKGMPKPKPFGKLIDGRWFTGHQSLHKTPQGVRYNRFWRLKQRPLFPGYILKDHSYK